MKTLAFNLLVGGALAATSFAGQEITSSKESKGTVPVTTCFNDHELQLDVYGAYSVGHGPDHAGPIHDHAWGGGIGASYFFTRNIGLGAEGFWQSARHNSAKPGDDSEDTVFHNVDGSLIFRFPIDSICVAPYALIGAGSELDGRGWAFGFGGVGLEYRVVPAKVGIFTDIRWNYYGEHFNHDDQNNFLVRGGVRLVF